MQLMRLRHPSLLAVLDLLQVNGTAYRLMRFEPGPTLFAHRRALDRAPASDDVAHWLDGLLGALAALHQAGMVHGDVTPDNIVLRPGERALLLDFGAVQRALAQPGANAKEPCSRPRESPWPQPPGPPSAESDRFGLAVTMRYALSGRMPPPMEPLVAIWQSQYPGQAMPELIAERLAALDAPAVGAPAPVPAPPPVLVEPLTIDLPVIPPTPAPAPVALTVAPPVTAATPTPAPEPAVAPATAEPAATAITPRAAWSMVGALVLLFGLALWSMKRDAPMSERVAVMPFAAATSSLPPLPPAPRLPLLPELSTVALAPTLPPLRDLPPIADVPPPPKPKPKPAPRRASPPPAARLAAAPTSPRQTCGDRTGFSLYRCMQLRCADAQWSGHAQCLRLRRSDEIE
jgi:serine/threonine protein kinase